MFQGLNTDDPQIVRQNLRDVVAMATLPAIWTGAEPLRIAESLAASLFTMLGAEMVIVCFREEAAGNPVAIAQTARYESSPSIGAELEPAIRDWARTHDPEELLVIPNPIGAGIVHVATRSVGHLAELGVVAAAFSDAEAMTPFHHLLLNVAATQATVAIQNAHLLLSVRRGEDAILRANAELAARVAELQRAQELEIERSQQVRRLVEDLRDTDRRKDEFLATLAHELRNPLAPIGNGLELMRLVEGDTDPTIAHVRTMMERQLAQLVRLVDDLMDVSRITRGRLELRRGPVELAGVINSAVETCAPLLESMGHRLVVEFPDERIEIDADATRLSQVLANLLNNAAKYTPRGGTIRLTATRQAHEIIIGVRDTGIGIPPAALPTIFDMFSQVDASLERAQGGLGIGLTLAKRLVAMHGGTIEARSGGAGEGAEFIVRLPIVLATNGIATDDPTGGEHTTSSLRILVVDDNRDSAESLSLMLALMGNEIRTVYDGEQAVVAAGEFSPDVILLDIGLPRLNGYDACRQIRQQTKGAEPVIIAQTGWGQQEDRTRTRDAGFDLHLVKPVDARALMRILAEYSARVGRS
jgi:signal transduction histidine kinase/ActR/RegA family two-component response regulator